ncbi:MAG TPA: glycosyltransferase family 4 protein [Parapedobacter sp.]|uniref:glycosyltransferase family 4 protein n=1 Tax=Parapedobacter sp. TaxID=1958893 RepID=UPI002D1D0586|nr:glycosyltransferase family 4 protein [Parapedobacter sp.]HWK56695.1 glycosyltransferase family 4 protein [Parapedobacter sp.]
MKCMTAVKICLVSNTAWSFVRFRIDVIVALRDAGCEVLLLAPPDDDVVTLKSLGVRVILLKELSRKGLNPIDDIRLYYEFKSIYQNERPDLIFQYTIKPNIYSSLAASRLGIPTIAVITGLGYAFINSGLVTWVVRRLYRLALSRVTQAWFLNQDDRDYFFRYRLVDAHKVSLIPGEGVDCHGRFNPALQLNQNTSESEVLRFLFVGRLLYDKGIKEYVEAAAYIRQHHRNVCFQILGYLNVDNPAAVRKEELMKWVKDDIVEYLGHTDDVRPYVLQADCVVLPSYREGMSTVLQESASLAKPIIASDIAGCKELVDDGVTGFLCEVKNVASLIQQLEKFLRLSECKRRMMGNSGREKMVAEFSVERVIERYQVEIASVRGR